jgi:hypothetical protein
MKRAFVFLLLGPTLVALTPSLIIVAEGGRVGGGFVEYVAMLLFLFTLVVSAITGPIDGYLAHALPLPLRAPLAAITGATIAVGLVLALFTMMLPHWTMPPQWLLTPFAIGGAFCMGVCSVLSNNYSR